MKLCAMSTSEFKGLETDLVQLLCRSS